MRSDINQAANLVGFIGQSDFDEHFYAFCQDLLNIDQCTVFHFGQQGSPHCLIAEANKRRFLDSVRQLAQEYTAGAWRRDPNLSFAMTAPQSAACHEASLQQRQAGAAGGQPETGGQPDMGGQPDTAVHCVWPAHIRDLDYRRRFYESVQVRQELTLIAWPNPHSHLYCSFYRSLKQPEFAHEDIAQLKMWASLLTAVLNKHVSVTRAHMQREMQIETQIEMQTDIGFDADSGQPASGSARRERMYRELRTRMLKLPCGLTQREADVCAAIALGYTTVGIGLNLGISVNTVATHRKRAYAKMGISCQNELFARYFDCLSTVRDSLN